MKSIEKVIEDVSIAQRAYDGIISNLEDCDVAKFKGCVPSYELLNIDDGSLNIITNGKYSKNIVGGLIRQIKKIPNLNLTEDINIVSDKDTYNSIVPIKKYEQKDSPDLLPEQSSPDRMYSNTNKSGNDFQIRCPTLPSQINDMNLNGNNFQYAIYDGNREVSKVISELIINKDDIRNPQPLGIMAPYGFGVTKSLVFALSLAGGESNGAYLQGNNKIEKYLPDMKMVKQYLEELCRSKVLCIDNFHEFLSGNKNKTLDAIINLLEERVYNNQITILGLNATKHEYGGFVGHASQNKRHKLVSQLSSLFPIPINEFQGKNYQEFVKQILQFSGCEFSSGLEKTVEHINEFLPLQMSPAEIMGYLNRIIGHTGMRKKISLQEIDMTLAQQKSLFCPVQDSISDIYDKIIKNTGWTRDEIKGGRRATKSAKKIRDSVIYVLHTTGHTEQEIADIININRQSVHYSLGSNKFTEDDKAKLKKELLR